MGTELKAAPADESSQRGWEQAEATGEEDTVRGAEGLPGEESSSCQMTERSKKI